MGNGDKRHVACQEILQSVQFSVICIFYNFKPSILKFVFLIYLSPTRFHKAKVWKDCEVDRLVRLDQGIQTTNNSVNHIRPANLETWKNRFLIPRKV